ncbi:MAG: hypothetical protein V1707_03070 [bacterium]
MDKKRILTIIAFVLIVILAAYGLYYFFFRTEEVPPITITPPAVTPTLPTAPSVQPSTSPVVPQEEEAPVGQPTTVAEGGPTKVTPLTETFGVSPTVSKVQGTVNVYNPRDGKFYQLRDGRQTLLTTKRFFNVSEINWNSEGNKAILGYPDGSKLYYDFSANSQVTLPKEMTEPRWNKEGSLLGFKWITNNEDSNWIGVSSPDGSGITFIEPLGDKGDDVRINWSPDSRIVATYRKGAGTDSQEVFFIGRSGENNKSLFVDGRGFESQWSPDGKKLLYSTFQLSGDALPMLKITNAGDDSTGFNNVSLDINTWAYKCVFGDSVTVYCAVPRSLEQGSGLYPELSLDQPDDFYKIDLKTGWRSLLAVPVADNGGKVAADQVTLSPDGDSLVFTNRFDGRLLELKLR